MAASDDKGRRHIAELIELSLGPATSFAVMRKSDFLARVEIEGLRCPSTIIIPATRAFESGPAEFIYPIVVKADQSYGGGCVRIVNSESNIRAAVWELQTQTRRSGDHRSIARTIDFKWGRGWYAK
jgi:hypothetical protein